MIESSLPRGRSPLLIAGVTALFGTVAAIHYHRLGLTLAHYDARAHLVVARRVFDSLTPGWQQVGAVWLPLPHLLNAPFVQIDALYRSGAAAIAISIASMALAAGAMAWTIERMTGSVLGGVVAAALLMLNPDVLYLQSTPMTEPLLFGTTFLAVALVAEWADDPHRRSLAAGWACIAACLTRYEAWPIVAAALALAFLVRVRRGQGIAVAARAVRGVALYPLWAIAAFLVNSKVSVGAWFVASGFFVPENPALGHPWTAWTQIWNGVQRLTGEPLPWIAFAAAIGIAITFARSRDRAAALVVLALAACAILPWAAYVKGHPLRVRYDVPLVAACSALVGMGVALLPRAARVVAGLAVLAMAIIGARPLDRTAPVIVESQREAPNAVGRHAVTAYLQAHWDGEPILMSMGSLGHYMHDLSLAGFNVRDFLHEGNGELWKAAVAHPWLYVEWIAVEEKAEGGDALYWEGRLDPRFLGRYDRVAQGGNVALYRLRR